MNVYYNILVHQYILPLRLCLPIKQHMFTCLVQASSTNPAPGRPPRRIPSPRCGCLPPRRAPPRINAKKRGGE